MRSSQVFLVALVSGLLTGNVAGARAGTPPDSLPSPPRATGVGAGLAATPGPSLFTRGDLWFGLASAGLVIAVAPQDRWLTDETLEAHSSGERDLARIARTMGDGGIVFPSLAGAWAIARLTHHPVAATAVTRVGVSVLAAGACSAALKEVVGRARPTHSLEDSDELQPFSGHDSFPSGHTTVAFALATALDRVTGARWVPWVVYPAAALCGWSRVHDRRHWTSDTIAGAAIGFGTASKTDRWLQNRSSRTPGVGLSLEPSGGAELVLTLRR